MMLYALFHAAESGYKAVVVNRGCRCIGAMVGDHQEHARHHQEYSMYWKCGMPNRIRFLDMTKLGHSLGCSVADALVGMHACNSCDIVSAFAGHWKMCEYFKLLKSDKA